MQSRAQSPRAFWSAGERQERLWDNGLHFPGKRGFRCYCACLSLKETAIKYSKEEKWRVESVRETKILALYTIKETGEMIIGLL